MKKNPKRLFVSENFHNKFKSEAAKKGLSIEKYSEELAKDTKTLDKMFTTIDKRKVKRSKFDFHY